MGRTLDVEAVQRALDALIMGDHKAAADWFTLDVVFDGPGGCLAGRTTGVVAVLDRFAEVARVTDGTFGSEVETIYAGGATQVVVITRHWASIDGNPIHGVEALILTVDGDRIGDVAALSPPGPPTGIWD